MVTSRTLGARVKLGDAELEVYDQDEEEKRFTPTRGGKKHGSSKPSARERRRMEDQEEEENEKLDADDQRTTMVASKQSDEENRLLYVSSLAKLQQNASFCLRFFPIPGYGHRAHITLGTSRDNKPVVTGFDVMDAVRAERKAYEVRSEFYCLFK